MRLFIRANNIVGDLQRNAKTDEEKKVLREKIDVYYNHMKRMNEFVKEEDLEKIENYINDFERMKESYR